MDSTELDDQLDTDEGGDEEPPKRLRSKLTESNRALTAEIEKREAAEAELKQFRRDKVFDELQIPPDGAGQLLREFYADKDEISADEVRKKAIAAGVLSGPAPEAGTGEQAAHAAFDSASGAPPPPMPDLETRLANATTKEEILRIVAEANEAGIVP